MCEGKRVVVFVVMSVTGFNDFAQPTHKLAHYVYAPLCSPLAHTHTHAHMQAHLVSPTALTHLLIIHFGLIECSVFKVESSYKRSPRIAE